LQPPNQAKLKKSFAWKFELSSLRSQLNWNDGMLEYWNNAMAPFGQIYARGEKREAGKLGEQFFS
jgi:hypothetical protein